MKKTFLLIAKSNSYGLVRDAALIAEQLEKNGHSVTQATPKDRSLISRLTRKKHADAIIFFERCFPAWFSAADELYLIPNQERYPKRQVNRLKKLNAVQSQAMNHRTHQAQHQVQRVAQENDCDCGNHAKSRLIPSIRAEGIECLGKLSTGQAECEQSQIA